MSRDSIEKRFFYKIITNMFRVVANLLHVTLVPRILGPAAYGQFGFLKANFGTIMSFLNMGSSQAFFIYNSKNDNSYAGVVFYSIFSALIACVVIVGGWLAISFNLHGYIWPQSEPRFIMLAAVLGITTWLLAIVTGFADSKGRTVKIEIIKLLSNIVGVIVLISLVTCGALNLSMYFLYSIGLCLLTMVLSLWYYQKIGLVGKKEPITLETTKDIGRYYYTFCAPLFIYSIFSFFYDIFDRWFLQIVAGSVEQAYYTIGFNFAAVCLMIVSAMTPIFMSEMSKAERKNTYDVMRALFSRYTRMIYALIAVISVFFAFHTGEIMNILYGDQYRDAVWPFFVMALYPLNAVYGQLNASVYFATERTALYRNINILNMIIGIAVTYFLLAPKHFIIPGGDLKALGLSLKKILTQFAAVNLLTYFNCRYLKIKYTPFLFHQIVAVVALSVLLWLIKGGSVMITDLPLKESIISSIVHGIIYGAIVCCIVLWKPPLVGLTRNDLQRLGKKFMNFLRI